MNLFCCTIEDWVQWTSVFANIATCLTAISAVIAIFYLFRNILTKRKFKTEIFLTSACITNKGMKAITFDLTFKNKTDKSISVMNLLIDYNGKKYQIFKSTTDTTDIKHEDLLANLSISPYESETFGGLFFAEKDIFSKKLPIRLIVETTRRNFKYRKTIDFNTANTKI